MPTYHVDAKDAGTRLDRWLSQTCADLSRSRIQQLIKSGHVLLNGRASKAHHPLAESDVITLEPPPPVEVAAQPEDIPLDVVYEDDAVLVLNKPAGIVVHPSAGHEGGTLVNALLHHCKDLAGIGGELRPGIVHRLDKDTSGVMIVAKTEHAMQSLSRQFKERQVKKGYTALVRGHIVPENGDIETLIGRNPHNRKKMSARVDAGRTARTRYATVETYRDASLLDVTIETGRTHQIRVHMAHLGHPILGDREYGRARTLPGDVHVDRQMLHAGRITFEHPTHGATLEFTAPLPGDMRLLIQRLRSNKETQDGTREG